MDSAEGDPGLGEGDGSGSGDGEFGEGDSGDSGWGDGSVDSVRETAPSGGVNGAGALGAGSGE